MRVNHYGVTTFDAKKQLYESKKKMKILIIYFLIAGLMFYLVKRILEINMTLFIDTLAGALQGKKLEFNAAKSLPNIKNNSLVKIVTDVYVFLENLMLYIEAYLYQFFQITR